MIKNGNFLSIMIQKIEKIATIDSLYLHRNEKTGELIVDAVVSALNASQTRLAGDIAKFVGVQQRQLTYAMEMLVGLSLKDFVSEWRLLQARDLCLHSDSPLHEVAALCGYANYGSLIDACMRRFGTTPFAIRNGKLIHNTNYLINQNSKSRNQVLRIANELRNEENMDTSHGSKKDI